MRYLPGCFSIILLVLSVSCKQNAADNSLGEGENNAKYLELQSQTESQIQNDNSTDKGGDLTALEVKDLIRDNPDLIIIDVRTPEEFELGKVESAINIDIYNQDFLLDIKKLRKDKKYLLYCAVGGRSSAATGLMKNEGFTDVFNSKKGFASLKDAGILVRE